MRTSRSALPSRCSYPPMRLTFRRLGIINTHPSLLPRYRGPNPIAWTVRNGDRELGYSIHRMDAHFDTGPLLAQGTTPIDDVEDPSELFERMFALLGSLLPNALARVEKGDPGDPQPDGQATYAEFFEPEYVEIDWSQTAAEVRRQVLAWRVAAARPGAHGAADHAARRARARAASPLSTMPRAEPAWTAPTLRSGSSRPSQHRYSTRGAASGPGWR